MEAHHTHSTRSLSVATNGRNRLSGPPSPTFTVTTNASVLNLGHAGPQRVITRADLRNSTAVYSELLASSATLRSALTALSKASANFAHAVDKCSRLKGAGHESGRSLQACSGLFYMIGNHWDILSASILEQCEKPLRQHCDAYRAKVDERSATYERMLRERSKAIRQTEMENMQAGRRRQRDLQTFRTALSKLQAQVDDLDRNKIAHYQSIYEHEEEVWDFVSTKVSTVARTSLDICDRLAAKASDPSLESVVHGPDPFEAYATKSEDQIFSVLPPLGILPSSSTTSLSLASDIISPGKAESTDLKSTVETWRGDVGGPGAAAKSNAASDAASRTIRRHESSKLRNSLSAIDEAQPASASDETPSPRSTIHVEAASLWGPSRQSSFTDDSPSLDPRAHRQSSSLSSSVTSSILGAVAQTSTPQKAR